MTLRPAVAIGLALFLAGCVADEPTRRPPPPQPEQIAPNAVQMFLNLPEDTNANGYADSVLVTVYLFADGYAPSVYVPGEFQFRLTDKEGKEAAQWSIPREVAEARVRKLPPGPGFIFTLSLLDRGSDQLTSNLLDLHCTFTPSGGAPVSSRPSTLRFGRTGS